MYNKYHPLFNKCAKNIIYRSNNLLLLVVGTWLIQSEKKEVGVKI